MTPKVSVRNGRSFVCVVLGPTGGSERRQCQAAIVAALATRRIAYDGLALGAGGCTFVVASADVADLRRALVSLNVAVRVRNECVELILPVARFVPRETTAFVAALVARDIDIVYLATTIYGQSIVVAACEASAALEVALTGATSASSLVA